MNSTQRSALMNRKFRMISDPGHGWLEVPIWASLAVGILPEQYSPYSYFLVVHGGDNLLYLEEDLDAGTFIEAFERETGASIEGRITWKHEEISTVRPLPHLPGTGYVSPFERKGAQR